MSKAILIMDMPESCDECPFCIREAIDKYLEEYIDYCMFSDEDILDECMFKRPDWCPLQPLPDRIEHSIYDYDTDTGYTCGWNDCIDSLIKE